MTRGPAACGVPHGRAVYDEDVSVVSILPSEERYWKEKFELDAAIPTTGEREPQTQKLAMWFLVCTISAFMVMVYLWHVTLASNSEDFLSK